MTQRHPVVAARCTMRAALVATTFVLAVALRAQTTWIVDASGGGHFTDLPPAVAAASPGDTLIVRAGRYNAPTISRALRILGRTGARVMTGRTAVRGLPAREHCTITDLTIAAGLDIESCQGSVHLDGCRINGVLRVVRFGPRLYGLGTTVIADSRHVSLHRCTLDSSDLYFGVTLYAAGSSVTLSESTATGLPPYWYAYYPIPLAFQGSPAIHAFSSLLSLRDSTIQGGGDGVSDGGWWGPIQVVGPPALIASHCEIRVSGLIPTVISTASSTSNATLAGGRLLYDPRALAMPGGISTTSPPTVATLDVVGITQTQTTIDFHVTAAAGATSHLLVSLPAEPIDLPGFGLSWLDAPSLVPLASRLHTLATETTTLSLIAPLPPGLPITAQAVVVRPGSIALSEAFTLILR